ncbi:MAG: CZB domain-containing protein [Gammaproteobacteria bacterium]|nr:CZB domain-containing protein [Gammaproteobacteria bacterium]
MDIAQEIDRHLQWIETAVSLIGDQSVTAGDLEEITQHDRCALGQWLNAEGSREFRDLPELELLKDSHEAFHKLAGTLVSAVEGGDESEAMAIQEDFIARSQELIGYLKVLQQKSQ